MCSSLPGECGPLRPASLPPGAGGPGAWELLPRPRRARSRRPREKAVGAGTRLRAKPRRVRARAEGGGRRLAGPVGRSGDPAVSRPRLLLWRLERVIVCCRGKAALAAQPPARHHLVAAAAAAAAAGCAAPAAAPGPGWRNRVSPTPSLGPAHRGYRGWLLQSRERGIDLAGEEQSWKLCCPVLMQVKL